MAIRIIHQLVITVSEDQAEPQRQILFKRDADLVKQTIDGYTKQTGGNFDVPAGDSQTFGIGDIASPAKGLYLEVNAECSAYLSGDPNPIILRIPPSPQTGAKARLVVEADVTSLEIEASQGADVSGTFCFWGGGTT